MKTSLYKKNKTRKRRNDHVRSRIRQESKRPRLSVHRSLKHMGVQVIDDAAGRTLAAISTTAKSLGEQLAGKTKTEKAAFLGGEIARLAQEAGIKSVVFDRGNCKYHGRVKALADAAREGGLDF